MAIHLMRDFDFLGRLQKNDNQIILQMVQLLSQQLQEKRLRIRRHYCYKTQLMIKK